MRQITLWRTSVTYECPYCLATLERRTSKWERRGLFFASASLFMASSIAIWAQFEPSLVKQGLFGNVQGLLYAISVIAYLLLLIAIFHGRRYFLKP
ncbi:hypothetical protein [Ottowia testudinis]|uniref:Uncharacterized protein n=1 Tax=Ottowia testudinis TaxID=2816950 RepID=A0A975CK92_9BURK|nr:hypothetical protein [Ottowia testudinis]QTD46616.1 hypothetical protein J1M35_06995 [Ottowia testudinis]